MMSENVDVQKSSHNIFIKSRLWKAVSILATGNESLRERLIEAVSSLNALNAKDFPADLQNEFVALMEELTSEGSIRATISGLRYPTTSRYAQRIVDLCSKTSERNICCE